VPRGHDPGHPHAERLRWKGVEAFARLDGDGEGAAPWVLGVWSAGAPLRAWLGTRVGPSGLPRAGQPRS